MLTDRMTRLIAVGRLPSITALAVRRAVRRMVSPGSLKVVRSITTDNGCEFPGSAALERFFKDINATLQDVINSIPRQVTFKGKTAHEAFLVAS